MCSVSWRVLFASVKLSPCLTLLSWRFLQNNHGRSISVVRDHHVSTCNMYVDASFVKPCENKYCLHPPFCLILVQGFNKGNRCSCYHAVVFEVPTQSKMTYLRSSQWLMFLFLFLFISMITSQTAIMFSQHGTPQNKELKKLSLKSWLKSWICIRGGRCENCNFVQKKKISCKKKEHIWFI